MGKLRELGKKIASGAIASKSAKSSFAAGVGKKVSSNAKSSFAGEAGKKVSSSVSEMPSTEVKMEDRMSMEGSSMEGSPMAMKGSWMSKHCRK